MAPTTEGWLNEAQDIFNFGLKKAWWIIEENTFDSLNEVRKWIADNIWVGNNNLEMIRVPKE